MLEIKDMTNCLQLDYQIDLCLPTSGLSRCHELNNLNQRREANE